MRFSRLIHMLPVLVLMSALADAQIRFTRSDVEPMFQDGKYTMFDASNAPGTTFNLGSKGSGNTWDFTVFQYTSGTADRAWIDPSLTPYADQFPDATHAQMYAGQENSYSYFLLNDDGVYSLGIGTEVQGTPYILVYNPKMPDFIFPMQLGSKWTYDGDPVSPLEGLTQETEMSVEAISSGTLITSQGSFEALCVKNVSKVTTRFEIGGQVLSEGYSTTTDYMFMTKNGVYGSLSVDTNDIDTMTPTLADASYTVEGEVNSVHESTGPRAFALDAAWPNPAAGGSEVNVSWTQEHAASVKITLHDMLGREMRSVFEGFAPAGSHALTIPTGDLPAGMYLLRGASAGITGGLQRIAIVR